MLNIINESVRDSLPADGVLKHNLKLEEKVSYRGSFLPFWGNTVVFTLDATTKAKLKTLQDALYAAAGDILAEPIDPDTFHMTLHDLTARMGKPKVDDFESLRTTAAACSLVEQWRGQKSLQMRCGWVFNMVNTSMVVSLYPNDHYTYLKLAEMYTELQQVVALPYKLCPHITLAYFRPGPMDKDQVKALKACIASHGEIIFDLPMEALQVQRFTDMNHYKPVTLPGQFQQASYRLSDGDLRTAVKVNYGIGYIAYVDSSGTGIAVTSVEADGTPPWPEKKTILELSEMGSGVWLEGADELIGIFSTRKDAQAAADRYFEDLTKG